MTPKDFFLHVGVMITLYVSSISLITLLFQVLNIVYPDPLSYYVDPYSTGIRWAVASIVIVFPLFLLLSWLIGRTYVSSPDKRNLGIRKWLIFLTLFVAGIAIVTDLVVLVNSFLGGELSSRFVFKVLVIFVVSGLVFGYYLWDLRRTNQTNNKKSIIFAGTAIGLVTASLVVGFLVMGSPSQQRLTGFDFQKLSDLQNIQYQIVYRWQREAGLPNSLSDLDDSISGFVAPTDVQTGKSYEYKKISELSFELCADFNLDSNENFNRAIAVPLPAENIKGTYGPNEADNWRHGSGRVCFQRTIDPKLYPPSLRP